MKKIKLNGDLEFRYEFNSKSTRYAAYEVRTKDNMLVMDGRGYIKESDDSNSITVSDGTILIAWFYKAVA